MIKGLLTNGIDIGTVGVLADETLSQESQKFWMTFWIRKREREKDSCRVCWKWFELICPATNIGCTMLIWKNIAEWRTAEWISHPASGGKVKSLQKPIMAFTSVLFNKLEGSPIQDVRFTQILPASHDPPSFPYDLLGNRQVVPSLDHPVFLWRWPHDMFNASILQVSNPSMELNHLVPPDYLNRHLLRCNVSNIGIPNRYKCCWIQ